MNAQPASDELGPGLQPVLNISSDVCNSPGMCRHCSGHFIDDNPGTMGLRNLPTRASTLVQTVLTPKSNPFPSGPLSTDRFSELPASFTGFLFFSSWWFGDDVVGLFARVSFALFQRT